VFHVRRTLETFDVTRTGLYTLVATGGKGANGRHKRGGRGAVIEGTFKFMKVSWRGWHGGPQAVELCRLVVMWVGGVYSKNG
jgi:hypothetical protein